MLYEEGAFMSDTTIKPAEKPASIGWLKFQAVLIIISGVYSCLVIVGIPIGIPYIFAGLRFWKAAKKADEFRVGGNTALAAESLEECLHSFRIQGLVAIIGTGVSIVLTIFGAVIMAILMATGVID
jgi:hypothetical protein